MEKTFFLTTIPGLESVTHLELCDKWGRAADFFNLPPYPDVYLTRGGVEVKAPLHFGFCLNYLLRSVNRILLRSLDFSAANEKEFVTGLKEVPFKDFLKKGSTYSVVFTSKSSKLSKPHQVEKLLQKELKSIGAKQEKTGQKIYVRIFRDKCNISFDCSGESAFLRKEDQVRGSVASLRESTASGLLRLLLQGLQNDQYTLIDPMCGAGTFLQEALKLHSPLKRNFACEKFPLFAKHQDTIKAYLENQDHKSSEGLPLPKQLFGFDKSQKALAIAKQKLRNFPEVSLVQEDLFADAKKDVTSFGETRVLVVNPPWGKRLPTSQGDLLPRLVDKFKPQRIGLLMPAHWKMASIPLEKVRDIPLLNSGVENRFVIFSD